MRKTERWAAALVVALTACGGGGGGEDDGGDAAPPAGDGGLEVDQGPPADDPEGDPDGDGLPNRVELAIGTDPGEVDSDGDGIDDNAEVGSRPEAPLDHDDDGFVNAIESNAADNDRDGRIDALDPSDGWQLTSARFYPFAIAGDGVDATRLEVRITGGTSVTAVRAGRSQAADSPLGAGPLDGLAVDGAPAGTSIELFDDGTHGDRRAGDGVWTRGGLTSRARTFSVGGKLATIVLDEVQVTDAGGTSARAVWTGYREGASTFSNGFFRLGVVAPSAVAAPAPIGEDAYATTNLLNLVRPRLMTKPVSFLRDVGEEMNQVAQAVYAVVGGDPFDFLYVWSEQPAMSAGAAGKALSVSSDVQGINRPPFDDSARFGSAGRLKAAIALDFNDNGPILHETMHTWGAYFSPPFDFDGAHWGYAGTDGQLGGFDPATLRDNGDGTYTVGAFGPFANGGDSKAYGPWELYLMGLLSPEQVPTVPVLRDPEQVGGGGGTLTFRASRVDQVSIDDVVAMYGPRSPAAQTAFAAGFVVVSQRPLTGAEMGYFEAQAALFGAERGDGLLQSFRQATGDRATMDTVIPR